MTTFLRLLSEKNKQRGLKTACEEFRAGSANAYTFNVMPDAFRAVPGSPFAYWVSDSVRQLFSASKPFENNSRTVRQGVATADDFRFVRGWWEVLPNKDNWPTFSKGGGFSRFYDPLPLVGRWKDGGKELIAFPRSAVRNPNFYLKPGLTWPLRSHTFCPQVLPSGTVFSTRGSAIFSENPLVYLGLFSSGMVDLLLRLLSGREGHPQYDMGDISLLPIPEIPTCTQAALCRLSVRGWSIQRTRSSVEETSHAFLLPAAIRGRLGDYDTSAHDAELTSIQSEIDEIAFVLYGLSDLDRTYALANREDFDRSNGVGDFEDSEEDTPTPIDNTEALLSWASGVAFGRFDWRLATGERDVSPEPDPFDSLPAKSPGMLPDGDAPFHAHSGILVDDQGHPHDLARLIEEVLTRVQTDVPEDVRRWLQRDFFPLHLKQYSKSRRKAPIYWPLSTTSGSYTLWLYYPSLTSQTLYTAVNDFVEPKLKHVSRDAATLRDKGAARSRDDERTFEALQGLELELIELRDTLLHIAPTYCPNHDDGVQISASPLWQLFRHKPWQRILKDTWGKLEKGDYDWAHLAMAYWRDRVREKCKTDKSLAIAHDLEDLHVEPEPRSGSKKKAAK